MAGYPATRAFLNQNGAPRLDRPTPGANLRPNNFTATFADPALELSYRAFLYEYGSPRERTVQLLAVALFLFYGALDVLAVGGFASEFLIIRFFIVAPIIIISVFLTSLPSCKKYVEWTSALGLAVCSAAIIYMIHRMPMEGAPPYIVGLLFCMIFTACLLRIRFVIAMPTYLGIAAAYCLGLALRNDVPQAQAAAGYFFMLSVTVVAGVAIYVQESRAREVWLRNLQRKIDAERIENLLIEATAADRSKINFLSILTHELRTPLHQIIGFSEVMKNQISTGDRANLIDEVEQVLGSARRLLEKIGQMLRYADATAGKLNYSIDKVPLTEVVEQAWDQIAPAADKRSITIDTSKVSPAIVEIDSHHTLYAISSIVENALNASPEGSAITMEGEPRSDSLYELRIIDNGAGMSRQAIAAAFKPFEQNEPVRSRSREGLGLGLATASHLLRGQQGDLSIESTVGKGTTVRIMLPLPKAPSPSASASPQTEGAITPLHANRS